MANENATPPKTPLYQKISIAIGTLVGIAILLPTLGFLFSSPATIRELKSHDIDKERRLINQEQITTQMAAVLQELKANDKDKERRITSHDQLLSEHGKEINGINNKLDRLENAITNGNRRTESDMKDMFKELTNLSASSRMIEKSVADAVSIANKASATADNAEVMSDGVKKEMDRLNRTPTVK